MLIRISPDRRADYQLALTTPGMSPLKASSRILLRPRPNLRKVPRGRPVSSQRLRWTRRVGVARQLLQLQAGGVALFVGLLRVVGDGRQLGVLLGELGDQLLALLLALDEGSLATGHLSS
jgi:hypothetical protein